MRDKDYNHSVILRKNIVPKLYKKLIWQINILRI